MKSETEYLLAGLEESRCVVLVVGFSKVGSLRRRMAYISPNAKDMGINQKVLLSGFKLPEDYIHVEDRPAFVEAVALARKENRDINYAVRIIGDDGVVRQVDLSIKIIDASEDDAEIIFFVREQSAVAVEELLRENELDFSIGSDFFKDTVADVIFNALPNSTGLYSAIVDTSGSLIEGPAGPDNYLGVFYDMFERPEYAELFEKIKTAAFLDVDEEGKYIPIDDRHPDSRITAYPITVENKTVGYWIVAGFTSDEASILSDRNASFEKMMNVMSDYIRRYTIAEDKIDKRQAAANRIAFEIKRHKILEECLEEINVDRTDAFTSCFQDIGELFETDFVGSYRHKNGKLILTVYWTNETSESEIERLSEIGTITESFEKDEKEEFEKNGFIVDNGNVTNRVRVTVLKGIARAIILMPIFVNGKCNGHIAVIERKKERIWKEEEIDFVRGLANVFGATEMLTDLENRMEKSNLYILETLNYLNACVFIKDLSSNEVLFSTNALNEVIGKEFTGMDSRLLIPDETDKFSKMGLAVKIHKAGQTRKWTRYMDVFDSNMNITEVDINWHGGKPAVLYILKKNGEMEII